MIYSFNGNTEKFHSEFFGLLCENVLPSRFEDASVTNILMLEVGIGISNFLNKRNSNTSSTTTTHVEIFFPQSVKLSEKECNSLQYLSGYIVQKLFKKFRYGRLSNGEAAKTYSALLLSFKVDSDDRQKLINIKDRGGLWRVNKVVHDVFLECELFFCEKTALVSRNFERTTFVKEFLQVSRTSQNFNALCLTADIKVSKEWRINLLDLMIPLYVNVRMFS